MNVEPEIILRKTISEVLRKDQRLLCLTKIRHSDSMYVTLLNDKNQYLTLTTTRDDSLKESLPALLREAAWQNFDYNDYFILSILKDSHNYHVSWQTMEPSSSNINFYQVKSLRKEGFKKIKFDNIDDKTNQVLQKLYATGLVLSYQTAEKSCLLYLSEAGLRLVDYFNDKYIEKFAKDYRYIDWNNPQLVVEPESKDQALFDSLF